MSRTKKAVEYKEVYRYLKHSSYEPKCPENRKRVIRRFSANIVLESDGHLWKTKPGPKKKWIHEKQAQQQILESVHVSGDRHCDRVKTKENLDSEPVFWPSIQKDIIDYIKRCEECQKVAPKLMKSAKRECISASATAPPGTEVAAKEHTSTAPPLTVDNVLKVIKGVDWRGFGEHLRRYYNVDEIVESCVSDEARLKAVVKHYLDNKHEPSWRELIWSLYEANQIELADPRIRSYAEPMEDDSLTVDNVTKVMEMITDDNIKVVWDCLRVPDSMVTGNLSTKKQKTQACVVLYLNYCPYGISWRYIAEILYCFDEMAAARKARTFLHKKDSTLTVDNLVRVIEKVTSDEEKKKKVWEEVLKWEDGIPHFYLDEVESKYTTAREKTNVLADVYVNSHPDPSWEQLVKELYCCDAMAAAKEAKSFLQKNDSTLTVDNLLRVLEKVTSEDKKERRQVWVEVLEWVYHVPESYLDEVESKYTTAREKTSDLADVYVNSHPEPSWKRLVGCLYLYSEIAAAKEAKSFLQNNDSTLTVENLLRVMEKVTSDEEKRRELWGTVLWWDCHVPYSYLNEVESKYTTAREKTNDLADVYVNSHPEPSWEQLVEHLYCCGEMAAAKEAKSFLQKNEPSLTVNHLVGVMGKVTLDKRKVWEKVLWYQEKDYYWNKYNPESYLDEVNTKYKTEEEKMSDLADVYVTSRPESSWEHLVRTLYESGEMEAAKETKSFIQQNEPSLSVNNLVRVIEKVTSDKETRRKVWRKVLKCQYKERWHMKEYTPDSYLDAIDIQYTAEKEKTNVLADVYINSHPYSSWKHLVKTLKQNGEQAAAEEAKSFLHLSDATATCTSDSLHSQTSQLEAPSTSGYIKVASDQPGSSSEDPPPTKYRKVSVPLSNGGASNESEERLAPTADCELTICTLKVLKSASDRKIINIIKRLAAKWTDLGDLLDFDKSSSKLDEIEEKYPHNPEACCRAMFKHWIEGNGVQPCTWSKLIELLKLCDQEELANDIEAALAV